MLDELFNIDLAIFFKEAEIIAKQAAELLSQPDELARLRAEARALLAQPVEESLAKVISQHPELTDSYVLDSGETVFEFSNRPDRLVCIADSEGFQMFWHVDGNSHMLALPDGSVSTGAALKAFSDHVR